MAQAGVTGASAIKIMMLVRGLIEHDRAGGFTMTRQG
jgi:hypothetical protein